MTDTWFLRIAIDAMRHGCQQRELTPKETLAIDFYANPKSPTFGNKTKSYIAAGYSNTSSVMQSACRMFNKDKIKHAIELYTPRTLVKRAEINREYAFNKYQELYDRCYDDHDNTNCVALMRMVWQQQGLLDNKLVINLEDSRQLEDGHREAARRIAAHLLSDGVLDAEFEPLSLPDNDSDNNSSRDDGLTDNSGAVIPTSDNIVDSSE